VVLGRDRDGGDALGRARHRADLGLSLPEVAPVGVAVPEAELHRLRDHKDHAHVRHVAQRAALAALEPKQADQETTALREVFVKKRNFMLKRLKQLGVVFKNEPLGTFYCWGSLAKLKPPFDDAMTFFRRALERKVITVPGEFFDVNPGKRRRAPSPYRQRMRFSFGPPMENVVLGLDRLEAMLRGKPARRR